MIEKQELDTCNGNCCSKKETCVLYEKFVDLTKDGKFPRTIDSMVCIEPIWQDEHFIKHEFSCYIKSKIKKRKEK